MRTAAVNQLKDDLTDITKDSPSHTHVLMALGIVPAIVMLVFCVSRPFAGVQLRTIEAFVPIYVTAMFLNGLITAVILFAQFSILRTRALLIIANGYLYLSFMTVPYTLAFPGVFEPGRGLLGGLQSTPWLYTLRHCGFALFVLAFALCVKPGGTNKLAQSNGPQTIFSSAAMTTFAVLVLAFICIAGEPRLPTIIKDRFHFDAAMIYYAGAPIASLYVVALVLLWFRRHTVLGLWLLVVTFVHLVGVPLSFYPPPVRFSVGWYTVVVMNFFANSLVLIVLLVEISKLYVRFSLAVRAQHREREARLVTGDALAAMISHEVKQPIAAMVMRAQTGVRWLDRAVPELDKAKRELERIAADGERAGMIIDSVRANFKKETGTRASFNVDDLIDENIALVRDDLRKRRILLRIERSEVAVKVMGDRTQVQQVVLNLLMNAIEAMSSEEGDRVLSVSSNVAEEDRVMVSIADTGSGIKPEDTERVFNPLFTTKPEGMGMGLSICRSIADAHGGAIWAVPNNPKGTIFHFVLPIGMSESPRS